MKPYIFLTGNNLDFAQDENGNEINIKNLSVSTPYQQVIYFSDRYGNIVNQNIDTLILRNTNIENMTVEAALQDDESESESGNNNGPVFVPILTLVDNTEETVFLKSANAVNTSCIRITIPDTSNPPQITAQIGLYGFLCNLFALTDSNYKIAANEGGYRVVSGAYIHYADYKKWVGKVKMDNLPQEQFDLLTAQADKGEMTVIPYEDLQADEIYECAVNREYSYEVNRKTELFSLELEFNEL